jgi:hypothetical protein
VRDKPTQAISAVKSPFAARRAQWRGCSIGCALYMGCNTEQPTSILYRVCTESRDPECHAAILGTYAGELVRLECGGVAKRGFVVLRGRGKERMALLAIIRQCSRALLATHHFIHLIHLNKALLLVYVEEFGFLPHVVVFHHSMRIPTCTRSRSYKAMSL